MMLTVDFQDLSALTYSAQFLTMFYGISGHHLRLQGFHFNFHPRMGPLMTRSDFFLGQDQAQTLVDTALVLIQGDGI